MVSEQERTPDGGILTFGVAAAALAEVGPRWFLRERCDTSIRSMRASNFAHTDKLKN